MKYSLLLAVLAGLMAVTSAGAGELQLRKLSETESKNGVPCLSAKFNLAKLGSYEFRNDVGLLEFLAFSGGISPYAGGDIVMVMRDGKALKVRVGQILDEPSKNFHLEAGDEVVVPTQGCFGGGLTNEEIAKINQRLQKFAEQR